jgi:lysozyme
VLTPAPNLKKMKSSEQLIIWIKQHEDFRANAYIDDYAGTPDRIEYSIGYGHQIQPYEDYLMNQTISKDYADFLLRDDVNKKEFFVNKYVTIPLTQKQFDALVNLNFAAGEGAVLKSGLYTAINNKD